MDTVLVLGRAQPPSVGPHAESNLRDDTTLPLRLSTELTAKQPHIVFFFPSALAFAWTPLRHCHGPYVSGVGTNQLSNDHKCKLLVPDGPLLVPCLSPHMRKETCSRGKMFSRWSADGLVTVDCPLVCTLTAQHMSGPRVSSSTGLP